MFLFNKSDNDKPLLLFLKTERSKKKILCVCMCVFKY